MKTIHIISHTHWDREWYQTFQQFRLRLVHLVDGLLAILKHDPEYKFFMLDGQTIVLEDYLHMRPDREEEIRQYIKRGRIVIGPWHILPDIFLVSPEAHIRNLLQGDRTSRKFGDKMMVGYMPDSFGHIGQMPQILNGFGIETASLWRGVLDQPCEFWWESPDGSRVLMAFLRESYGNGASLPANDRPGFTDQLKAQIETLAAHSAADHLLIMFGTDHMEPSRDTSAAIRFADEKLSLHNEAHVIHSTLPKYVAALRETLDFDCLPVQKGELRASKRSPLLPGVLSTRMWIKQLNRASESLLEKWVEPFSTFADWMLDEGRQVTGTSTRISNPASLICQTWRLLMENHPHDSICGCSIDQVHDEMKVRFDQVGQVGEELTRQSLAAIAGEIDTQKLTTDHSPLSIVVVFNPTSAPRTDRVETELSLPTSLEAFELMDENGAVIPHESLGRSSAELINMVMDRKGLREGLAMVNEGRITGLAVQTFSAEREGGKARIELTLSEGEPDDNEWRTGVERTRAMLEDDTITQFHVRARSLPASRVIFAAPDVPGLGYRAFAVRPASLKSAAPAKVSPLASALLPLAKTGLGQKLIGRLSAESAQKPPYIIENEFFKVEAVQDGTLTLTDKRDGKVYSGLNRFVDGGDRGDEYNFCPPESDTPQLATKLWGVKVHRSPVAQTLELALELTLPASLSEDRKSRSAETADMGIIISATLTSGVARLDIHSEVENLAKDHRLRVHFPTGMVDSTEVPVSADYDGHFEVVRRPIGTPAFDKTWVEQPRPETFQRAFTDVSDGKKGLMIANRGLPETEVLRYNDGRTVTALTLLRCVGWLSRDDLYLRPGHAGPGLETPAAQMIGDWEFDYSVIPHSETAHHDAYAFEVPLRALTTGIHAGTLPSAGSFVAVEPAEFVISAVKQTEDGKKWLVRGYNISNKGIDVKLKFINTIKTASLANLAEEEKEMLQVKDGNNISFTAKAHQVVTVILQ